MKKKFLLLFFSCCLTNFLLSQQTSYPESNPDRIAVFYFHCKDVPDEELLSTDDLKKYLFDEDSPVRKFWKENFNNHYNYTGEAFGPIEIPFTEDEFSPIKRGESFSDHLRQKLSEESDMLRKHLDRLNDDELDYLIATENHIFTKKNKEEIDEAIDKLTNYINSRHIRSINTQLKKVEQMLSENPSAEKKKRLSEIKGMLEEEEKRVDTQLKRLTDLRKLKSGEFTVSKKNELIQKKDEDNQSGLVKDDTKRLKVFEKVIPEIRLTIKNFDPSQFDKIIFWLEEKSLKSAGDFRGFYDNNFSITVKNEENEEVLINKPVMTLKGIDFRDKMTCFYHVDAPNSLSLEKDDNCYKEFNLYGKAGGYTLLHEWGHSLNLGHAQMPCADEECSRAYSSTHPQYFEFDFIENKSEYDHSFHRYGDGFDYMGSSSNFSMLFSTLNRDKAGLLMEQEKIVVNEDKKELKLLPLHLTGNIEAPRTAVIDIQSGKKIHTPLIAIPYIDQAINKPKANLKLYLEYRRGESYNKNLAKGELSKNTNGLMIRLNLEDIEIPSFSYTDKNGYDRQYDKGERDKNDLEKMSFLLDMTPNDGRSTVTLNPGNTFYHDDWEITIGNVDSHGDEGVTFDVTYGKKEDLSSNVYKTAYYSGGYMVLGQRPVSMLYSKDFKYSMEVIDGELVIVERSDNQIVWNGAYQGIPANFLVSRLEFEDGNLILSSDQETIWSSGTSGHPNSKFIINEYGKPNIIDEDGNIIWSEKTMVLGCKYSKSGARATLLSHDGEQIKLQMDWDEMSGFSANKSLEITNGECINCPNLGGSRAKREIYDIKTINRHQPTYIEWGEVTSRYCGEGSLRILNDVLPCDNSTAGSQLTYVKNDALGDHLVIDWNEKTNFDANSLELTNGECVNCPPITASAESSKGEFIVVPKELSEPILVKWKDSDLCGNGSLKLPSNALFCTHSKSGAKISYLSHDGENIELQVDWDEMSGFGRNTLEITNGECVDCPNIGGSNLKRAIYKIKPEQPTQPVIVNWGAATPYCGVGSLNIPTYTLPCENQNSESKITYITNDGLEAQLLVDWDEMSTFSSENLTIENGECSNCPNVGGSNLKRAMYFLKPTNLPEPITVKWKRSDYCGNASLTIPNYDLQCEDGKTNAVVTYLPNEEDELIHLHAKWDKNSTFDPKYLKITNGKLLEGDRNEEGIFNITPTHLPNQVIVGWDPSSKCGNDLLPLPTYSLLCKNGETTSKSKITYISSDQTGTQLHIDWNENSDFSEKMLKIENGECIECPLMNSGSSEAIYTIKPTNLPKPITVKWSDQNRCGNTSFQLPNLDLPCKHSKSGAKLTLLSNDKEGNIQLYVDWNELSGFGNKSLVITNGDCIDCPKLGGNDPKKAIYSIKAQNPNNPVIVKWKPTPYCGSNFLKIDPAE